MLSRLASAPIASSQPNSATFAVISARTSGGAMRIPRSKSTRGSVPGASMSDVMTMGFSRPPLTRVEHDTERERHAAVELAGPVRLEVEHVTVEERELAVELAHYVLRAVAHD